MLLITPRGAHLMVNTPVATVTTWIPVRGDDCATGQPEDIALLTLSEPGALPVGVWPARLPGRLVGHRFTVCGFAEGSVAGVWSDAGTAPSHWPGAGCMGTLVPP